MKIAKPLVVFSFLILVSCGGGDDDPATIVPGPIPDPEASSLVFPENDKECNQGAVKNNIQSDVTFEWNTSKNTDSYEINLKNLNTGTTTKTTSSTNKVTITILRGTPYEWFVTSKASKTSVTATSTTWKFYNEGKGIENYAPFPASAISPARGSQINESGTVSLQWSGSDVDNDIKDYEVFFETANPPTTSLGVITTTTKDATITSGSTYYWQVVTTDNQTNKSTSEVFEFKVK